MKKRYEEITKHIPGLEDHGSLYMYYGVPHSEDCLVYSDENEDGHLIMSDECDELCIAIAEEFQYKFKWYDVFDDNKITLETIFDVDVEVQDFDVITAILLYLVDSLMLEDRFIDALNNGFLLRVLKRLEYWSMAGESV